MDKLGIYGSVSTGYTLADYRQEYVKLGMKVKQYADVEEFVRDYGKGFAE